MDPTWWCKALLWAIGISLLILGGIPVVIVGGIDEGVGQVGPGFVAAAFGFVLCFLALVWRK
jgi:hypothetical protein